MAKRGGKLFYEREKAGNVRNKLLDDIYLVLTDDPITEEWTDLKKQLILKMSNNVLPRLNEHTGNDGGPIEVSDVSKLNDKELIELAKGGSEGTS